MLFGKGAVIWSPVTLSYETIRLRHTKHFCQFGWSFSQIYISHHDKVSWLSLVIMATYNTTILVQKQYYNDLSLWREFEMSLQHKLLGVVIFPKKHVALKLVSTRHGPIPLHNCFTALVHSWYLPVFCFSSMNNTMANYFNALIIMYTPFPNINLFLVIPAGTTD